jgi:hypothetical protein
MHDPMLRIIGLAATVLIFIIFVLWLAPKSFFASPTQKIPDPSLAAPSSAAQNSEKS